MAQDIKIRAAGRPDEARIRALLESSFAGNAKSVASVMAWQYWDNPFGVARSWVAEAEDQIVAHYAGISLPARLGGVARTVAIGVDAATHPSYRGLGLFEQLARAVYTDAGKAGMPVTYCLPNPNSLRGFRKAGGQDLGQARVLVAPISTEWVADRFRLPKAAARAAAGLFPLPAGTGAVVVPELPDGLGDLWGQVEASWGNGVVRSEAWWRWRYQGRPVDPGYLYVEARRSGRLVGAGVGLCRDDLGGRMLCILELLAADREAAGAVIGRLAEAGPTLGAVGIAATAMSNTPPYRLARGAGLRPLPRRLEPQPMHVGLVDNLNTLPGIAQRPWSLSWGDLDHL